MNTCRRDIPQLVLKRKPHQNGKRDRDGVGNQTPYVTKHKQEGHNY